MKGIYKVCKGTSVSGKKYNPATERNPDAKGNNKSRTGFTFCCYSHHLGKHFQNVVKISIRETISLFHSQFTKYEIDSRLIPVREALNKSITARIGNDSGGEYKKEFMLQLVDLFLIVSERPEAFEELFNGRILNGVISKAHSWIGKYYDKDAYVYEDSRLIIISGLLKNAVKTEFKNSDVLQDIVDLVIFLMKEDIYYRARWPLVLRDISATMKEVSEDTDYPLVGVLKSLCETCEHFELTAEERANIVRCH